ncbi:MAG: 2-C-methyl-D-erythritol 2,4-cyclodiphosphate synthase [Bdellovibrionales bacterium]|nr:2-C-methyl-D-erythritol 2,4-cyclodiphosphate synthase [Bdellovibrionales bacterium]
MTSFDLRIGQGIDVHSFGGAGPIMLGGVVIECEVGLTGHSDADVLLHAIVDALLGACGKPDIGARYPDTDPRLKGADSLVFLEEVWKEIESSGWEIVNIDCTILAQKPKIAPHVGAIKNRISAVLNVDPEQIGIKATTTETLGFVGREEGIVASCVALIKKVA